MSSGRNFSPRIQIMAATGMHNMYLVFGAMSILWSLNNIPRAGAVNPPGTLSHGGLQLQDTFIIK